MRIRKWGVWVSTYGGTRTNAGSRNTPVDYRRRYAQFTYSIKGNQPSSDTATEVLCKILNIDPGKITT